MKTRTLIVAMCLALLGGGVALAAEVGNNPQGTGWRWDFGFDRSEREVELDQPAQVYLYEYTYDYSPDEYGYERYTEWIDSFNGRETLDKYFLRGAYGLGERYTFYVTLGMASMMSEMYDPITRSLYEDYEYYYGEEDYYWDEYMETSPGTAGRGNWDPFYGAGFKAVFHDAGGFKVGMDVQWNQYKLDSDVCMYLNMDEWGDGPIDDPYYVNLYSDSHTLLETDTTEYQAALVFSKQNPQFSPYGGLKLSQHETDYSGEWAYFKGSLNGPSRQSVYEESGSWTLSTKQADYFGMFLGLDCEMTDRFVISGEIRVGDEKAATVKMSLKF